mgnify:FL=1
MKKFLLVLLILLLGFGGYILYDTYHEKGIPKLDTQEEVVSIDELLIYGTHLNLHGNTIQDENLDLVLYNGEFREYTINNTSDGFNLADTINEGMYLEDIPVGTYYVFLRSSTKDDKDKDVFRYYILKNNTEYKETTYYTFSNIGNKMVINSNNDYNTIMIDVTKNTLLEEFYGETYRISGA